MMQMSQQKPAVMPPMEPLWAEVNIVLELDDGSYLLDDGRLAQQAVSCLLRPCAGDRALVASCKGGENYILHLLHRPRSNTACLSVPGVRQLAISQAQIDLSATEGLTLSALHDVEITAVAGVLRMTARNLFTTVSESLVENIHHYIGRAEQYLLDVKQVLRMHGKQASVTAEHDVKIDAERISLG